MAGRSTIKTANSFLIETSRHVGAIRPDADSSAVVSDLQRAPGAPRPIANNDALRLHYTDTMKNALLLMLTGALLGIAAASFVVPPMIGWYTSPGGLPQGGEIQAVVQIPEVIRYATTRLIWGQVIGGGMGAALGLAAFLMSRRPPAPAPTPAGPASASH
jgi:hypothetical protein